MPYTVSGVSAYKIRSYGDKAWYSLKKVLYTVTMPCFVLYIVTIFV